MFELAHARRPCGWQVPSSAKVVGGTESHMSSMPAIATNAVGTIHADLIGRTSPVYSIPNYGSAAEISRYECESWGHCGFTG